MVGLIVAIIAEAIIIWVSVTFGYFLCALRNRDE